MASRDSRELPKLEGLEADYELVRELGRGATSVVYFARERAVDRSVAIKLIRPSFIEDDESAARLLQEAAVAGRLNHPNIVTLLGTRRLGDRQLALIFRYVPGMTLKERLRTQGVVPHAEARRILMDLGRALAYVHGRGIVHGNVSPRNIHLDGEAGLARLAGFGMARLPGGGSRPEHRSAVLDRAGYMAPEGLRGEELDERSDVFSLGLVAYEMLTGEAEPHTPLAEHCPGLPPRMRAVIQRALRTDPNERWPDAEAFLAALGEPVVTQADTAEDTPVAGPSDGTAAYPRSWRALQEANGVGRAASGRSLLGRIPAMRGLSLLGLLLLMGGFVLVTSGPGRLVDPLVTNLRLAASWLEEPLSRWEPSSAVSSNSEVGEDPDASPGATGTLDPVENLERGTSSEPAGVTVVGGRSRIGMPGAPLLGPVVLRVVDEQGVGVPGIEVSFEVMSGGGSVEPEREVTDPGGAVSAFWTLGDAEGEQVLHAGVAGRDDVPDLVAEVTAHATTEVAGAAAGDEADSGEATALEVARGADQEASPGAALPGPLEVRVTDGEGRPLRDVEVRFLVTAGRGSAAPVAAATDADGIARTEWTLGSEEGRQEILAFIEASPSLNVVFSARASAPRLPIRPAVAAGGTHACSLEPDGSLICWGGNDGGQLGDGTRARRVTGGAAVEGGPFAAIGAGVSHTCALSTTGTLSCWGLNASGQLGDGSTTSRDSPVPVSGNRAFASVSTGESHSCALTEDGAAFCWGANDQGQLGNGSTDPRSAPAAVRSSLRFRQIAAGWRHTCALDEEGGAHCWGSNEAGEAGRDDGSASPTPRPVDGGHRFRSLAAGGAHTCGLTEQGQILCWGANGSGQLGDGTDRSRAAPAQISASGPFADVVAGAIHSCGLATGGELRCWGGNLYGQVGDGSTTDRPTPVRVSGNPRFSQVHALGSHTCGRTSDEQVFCWGYNVEGQLGDGTRENQPVPTRVDR